MVRTLIMQAYGVNCFFIESLITKYYFPATAFKPGAGFTRSAHFDLKLLISSPSMVQVNALSHIKEQPMDSKINADEIQANALKRMHAYTCAEASLQAFLELFNLPKDNYSWACAGYAGAILSGQATCGLLIGSGIAISLAVGRGRNSLPEEDGPSRNRAIQHVGRLYKEFVERFGSTSCTALCHCDWSKQDDIAQYVQEKRWKSTCDEQLRFVIEIGRSIGEELHMQ
jgi:hypothetical protein